MTSFVTGWFRQMLRVGGHEHGRDLGRQDRAQVAPGEAAPEGQNGAGDHFAQSSEPCFRRQAPRLLRGQRLRLHCLGALSAKISHGAAQEEEGRDRAGGQILYEPNSARRQIPPRKQDHSQGSQARKYLPQ